MPYIVTWEDLVEDSPLLDKRLFISKTLIGPGHDGEEPHRDQQVCKEEHPPGPFHSGSAADGSSTPLPSYHSPGFHGPFSRISLELLSSVPLPPPSSGPSKGGKSGEGGEGPLELGRAMGTQNKRATSPDTTLALPSEPTGP